MTTQADTGRPADTRVMGIVHSALRRDLSRAHEVLERWPFPQDAQRVAVAGHLHWMMDFLHHHHESEDEHLYPMACERNESARPLLDRMDADHRTIEPAMTALDRAATHYQHSPEAREEVVAALDDLSAALLPHLQREEEQMMPVVSETITEAEWRHWDDEYNIEPLGPIELSDQGLFILDGLEGQRRDAITELVPPIPRWFILHVMMRRYRRQAFRRWRSAEFSPLKTPLRGIQEATTSSSPRQVWDVLTDVTRVGEWSHECRTARWLDGDTHAVPGARFRGTSTSGWKRWSRDCTFTTVDARHELAWVTHGGIWGDATEWRYRLTPTTEGTVITQAYQVLTMPWWFDRAVWVLMPAHHDRRPALRGDLERLGQVAGG